MAVLNNFVNLNIYIMIKNYGLLILKTLSSKRIIIFKLKIRLLEKLSEKFSRFDLTAIEYKPFTRFTVAKYLDDLTNNELSKYLNEYFER
jgi:protein CsiD